MVFRWFSDGFPMVFLWFSHGLPEAKAPTHHPPLHRWCPLVSTPEEQGGFDWLDMFKAKHPNYTELSDRASESVRDGELDGMGWESSLGIGLKQSKEI